MGAVQRLATVVVLGLVGLASVLILYLADESNRIDQFAEDQEEAAIERGEATFLSQCIACHGPAGEGRSAPGEAGTGRIGAPLGGDTYALSLNQEGLNPEGTPWSDPVNPQFGTGFEGRANYLDWRIHNGVKLTDGSYLMPAFGEEFNGALNDTQIEELVVFIQHADWNAVYNKAIDENGGYPTPPPAAATPVADATSVATEESSGPGIVIKMEDALRFEPAEVRIPVGQEITITLQNAGALPHQFKIDALGIDSGEVPGGASAQVTIPALEAGEYEFHCPVPGHTEGGMVGTLIVDPNAPTDSGGPEPGGSPEAAASPEPGGGDSGAAPPPLELDMVDLAFEPAELTIPAGSPSVVKLVNKGALPHNFSIPSEGISVDVAAGATGEVELTLPSGEYEFICAVAGHKEAGMVGKLVVDAGTGGEGGSDQISTEPTVSSQSDVAPGDITTINLEVGMFDLRFEPAEITIQAGKTTIVTLVNNGALPHNFSISSESISVDIAAGETGQVELALPAGVYEIVCSVAGHKEAGMVAKLLVQ